MDLEDQLTQLADRIIKLKDSINSEEATKMAFIMPFISALGYDTSNPIEVVPEFTADIGTKHGEKVDFAILKDNQPIILIECKHCKDDLDLYNTQLLRYFNVTKAKFAILTNGLLYRFYTDLEETNKMDEKPFFEFNILELKDTQIEEIKKFHKSYFDLDNIMNTANTLKYSNEIKTILSNEFKEPSEDFTKYFIYKVYEGKATGRVINQFKEIVEISYQQFLSDLITERLKTALAKEKGSEKKLIENKSKESKIKTTEEEIEGFHIVKSIIRQVIDPNRIFYRDFQKFFSILIDDSVRNTVCRLYLTDEDKEIAFLDATKNETIYPLKTLDDIFLYADQLKSSAMNFIK